jgi:hypothetical protein
MLNDSAQSIVSFDGCDSSWGLDGGGDDLLAADVPTTTQCYPVSAVSPQYRLLFAILEDAFCSLQRNSVARNGRRGILFRKTEDWLFDKYSPAFPSCTMACESLGIDAVQLGRYLRKWQRSAKVSPNTHRLGWRGPASAEPRNNASGVHAAAAGV